METKRSTASRLAALIGLLAALTAIPVSRHLRKERESPAGGAGSSGSAAGGADMASGKDSRSKERAEPPKHPALHDVDGLVAIHKKDGAAAALAAAKAMTGPERDSMVLFVLTYLARTDPEFVAGELAAAGLLVTHQRFVVDAVMDRWTDGGKALKWATTQLTGDLRKAAVGMALKILVRSDSAAALAHLEAMPDSDSRSQAVADLFSAWGDHDSKAALAYLETHLGEDERMSAMGHVVSSWARKNPTEAAAWVESLKDEALMYRLAGDLLWPWSSKSPEEAKAWLASLPEGEGKKALSERFSTPALSSDKDHGAIVLPDTGWKNKPVAEMTVGDLRNWAYQDPEGARKFLEGSPQGTDLKEMASTVASGIKRKEGPDAAFEWARSLPPELGNEALRGSVIGWAGERPEEAAAKLESLAAERRGPLSETLVETWARNDPAAAAAWVAAYSGGEQKELVVKALEQWTRLEPQEAYRWLGALPAGAARDEGILYLYRREVSKDPKAVEPWIEMISEPKLKESKRRELQQHLAE